MIFPSYHSFKIEKIVCAFFFVAIVLMSKIMNMHILREKKEVKTNKKETQRSKQILQHSYLSQN